jgi:hypothetical protein
MGIDFLQFQPQLLAALIGVLLAVPLRLPAASSPARPARRRLASAIVGLAFAFVALAPVVTPMTSRSLGPVIFGLLAGTCLVLLPVVVAGFIIRRLQRRGRLSVLAVPFAIGGGLLLGWVVVPMALLLASSGVIWVLRDGGG